MDMNTIEAVVRTTDPADWRDGDAWLAGGTVLFSYGSTAFGPEPLPAPAGPRLRRLAGPSPVTADGIELAATCTVAELYALPEKLAEEATRDWPGLDLIRPCCDSFVASFKVWNMSTVGGNLCTSLPAGPMISLCAGLDGTATVLGPDGSRRELPVADFITGDGQTPWHPASCSAASACRRRPCPPRVAFRRLSLSNLGRSGVLLIGRLDGGGALILTVTAATKRPVQLRFASLPGAPSWRTDSAPPSRRASTTTTSTGCPPGASDMTHRLAEEIRAELAAPAGSTGSSVRRLLAAADASADRTSRKGPEHGHRNQRRAGPGEPRPGPVPAHVPAGAGQLRREEGLRRAATAAPARSTWTACPCTAASTPRCAPKAGPSPPRGPRRPARRRPTCTRCSSSSWTARASSAASARRAW